jgi:uncharacterized protein (DUF983 family)
MVRAMDQAIESAAVDDRPMRPAILRGWQRRCPACGEGALMDGYLTVRDHCPRCGEALHHQRADDGPAWATILVAGKTLALVMLPVYEIFRPGPLAMAVGFSAVFVALALYLLPRFKGAFVGIQWSRRMHGFGAEPGLAQRS